MSKEIQRTSPYEHYWWDCPHCGHMNDCGDIEPSGVETCEECHTKVEVMR